MEDFLLIKIFQCLQKTSLMMKSSSYILLASVFYSSVDSVGIRSVVVLQQKNKQQQEERDKMSCIRIGQKPTTGSAQLCGCLSFSHNKNKLSFFEQHIKATRQFKMLYVRKCLLFADYVVLSSSSSFNLWSEFTPALFSSLYEQVGVV